MEIQENCSLVLALDDGCLKLTQPRLREAPCTSTLFVCHYRIPCRLLVSVRPVFSQIPVITLRLRRVSCELPQMYYDEAAR